MAGGIFGLVQHEWFQPLPRRIGTTLLPFAGLVVELVFGDPAVAAGDNIWVWLWGGILVYAIYGFFFSGYYNTPDGGGTSGSTGD